MKKTDDIPYNDLERVKEICAELLGTNIPEVKRRTLSKKINEYDLAIQSDNKIKKINYFFEIKFWEEFIRMSVITQSMTRFVVIKVESLELILRQILFKNLINVQKKRDLLLEIYMQNRYENFEIFKHFKNIANQHAQAYDIYVNMSHLHNLKAHSDKFNLNELIHYYKINPTKQDFPDKTKTIYSMGYLKGLCSFFQNQVKNGEFGDYGFLDHSL